MTEEEKKDIVGNDDTSKSDNSKETEKLEDVLGEPEFLKKLPPEAKKVVEIGMSMQRFGPMPNPLTEKLNEQHIDRILDISAKDDERAFEDAKESRRFTLIYVLAFIALFVFLTIFLVDVDKELYKEAVKLFAVFLGGFGGGFGVKTYMDKDK